MCFFRKCCWLLLLIVLCGCGDNLVPSGDDKRPLVVAGTTGSAVGQKAPDFTVTDVTNGNDIVVTLPMLLASKKAVVIYFTMWCPICDTDMSLMRDSLIPLFPDVRFCAVDYVNGTLADVRNSASANGFANGSFTILADIANIIEASYSGTMGTTIVIDSGGIVRMNENFRDGSRLNAVLSALP